MGLNFAPKSIQTSVQLIVPFTHSSSKKPASFVSSSLFKTHSTSNPHLIYQNGFKSWVLRSWTSRSNSLKRSCSVNYNEFSDDELSKQAEDLAQRLDIIDDDDGRGDHDDNDICVSMGFAMQFMPSKKYELLEHNLFGVRPESMYWPEREEIARVNIEQKANCVGIPLSVRMIKRKQKWQEDFGAPGDFAYCSVKKAFSSLVFIIRELQIYALHIRECLYCEDLKEIINKLQRELNSSFVWLFQQVFARTPILMVYVMIILANFTVHSMSNNIVVAACPSPRSSETVAQTLTRTEEKNQEQSKIDSFTIKRLLASTSDVGVSGDRRKAGLGSSGNGDRHLRRSSPSIQYPSFFPDETSEVSSSEHYHMTKEEVDLWNLLQEEASRMREESGYRILDHATVGHFVAPVTVKLEPDDYVDYLRTDLLYQMAVAEEPNNPLLLTNYAQFLHLVARDYDRAEECFKRATQVEPPDAEALSRYADFLWMVRNDLWAAEERYQEAMEAEPSSSSYASKYANFLWNTGGEETCYPLNNSHGNYNKTF